ncbi:helix-turn-helix domain-containing protein [Actinoplanes sp. NPDC051513]|uniref:helix-turn-helix domain-containing protein n=1 Tax=Actinoplanes sp. NPDC051513 TaxID=3363908 RepID=UPI0037975C02
MSTTFRTADAPAASREDYWHHVVTSALGPLDLHIDSPLDAGDELTLGGVGGVRVGVLEASAAQVSRTSRHIKQSDPDFCKVDLLVRGGGVIQQDEREARLRPGDLTLVDLSRPSVWAMAPSHVIAIVFPRALLPLHTDELARLTAVTVPGEQGLGALASTLVTRMPEHLDGAGESGAWSVGARLGTAVLDLLAAAFAARLGRDTVVPFETRQRVLLHRIHAFIEDHLADPDLSPHTIAAAHHVSVRYLYKLFDTQQTTVAAWIRHRRLDRARHDLQHPELRDRTITAIAARWGFSSPAHFNRVFRNAYGVAPGEYRVLPPRG